MSTTASVSLSLFSKSPNIWVVLGPPKRQHIKILGCTKAILRGKFIAVNIYVRKNNLSFYLKKSEKEQQVNLK